MLILTKSHIKAYTKKSGVFVPAHEDKRVKKPVVTEKRGLDMSYAARMERAKAMGFDTSKVWYHGGFEDFTEFDPKRSGSGGFHFAETEYDADMYARTKSQDEQGDYDIVVRPFYLPEKLFDPANERHIEALKAVLPDKLTTSSTYGWAAWGEPEEHDRATLLELIQGIDTPSTGFDDKAKEKIQAGDKTVWRNGEWVTVMGYEPETKTVEWIPSWQVNDIKSTEGGIKWFEENYGADAFQLIEQRQKLKHQKEQLKPVKTRLYPMKEGGYDNWDILESQELRPYLEKLGFEGAVMKESKKRTAVVFNPNRIRSINAEFKDADSANLLKSIGEKQHDLFQ